MVQAVSRAFRAKSCPNCRLTLLQVFTSISGIPWQPTHLPTRATRPAFRLGNRGYSTSPIQSIRQDNGLAEDLEEIHASKSATHEDAVQRSEIEVDGISETEVNGKEESELQADSEVEPQTEKNEQAESVPWYLAVDAPTKPIALVSLRQIIPELPESPPAILQPLLQQISIDLGINDLSLLDLRKLDPPPALGANLIMIIGTARSEKHLHVSADRLCRWLRSNYKLRPDADGLLGRAELKLKLKRKAKRAKLLGGSSEDDADDGVRTGWVCVDVGTVESSVINEEQPVDDGYIGFGRRTDGTKIVVQLLVEEKRIELDLERLWGGIAQRQGASASEAEIEDTPSIDNAHIQEDSSPEEPTSSEAKGTYTSPFSTTKAFSPIAAQARGFHTAARIMNSSY